MYDLLRTPAPDYLAGIFACLNDEIYVYDQYDLALIYANPSACQKRNWDQKDLSGKRISDLSDRMTIALVRRHLAPLMGGHADIVHANLILDGSPVKITSHVATFPGAGNVYVSILQPPSSTTSNPDDEWGAISELSHEMRTPLTSIKGAIGLLESKAVCDLPPSAQSVLQVASRNSDRLLSMVNRILDFSAVSSRKIEKEHSPVDLVSLVKTSVTEMQGFAFEHNVNVMVAQVPDRALVVGNSEQLTSVLINLLSNAIKHAPNGSTVKASIADTNGSWRTSVFDSGPGIPEASRSRIFECYTKGQSKKGKRSSGTGLGLAIAKKIVTLHNGFIDFIFTHNQGTEFYFEISKHPA